MDDSQRGCMAGWEFPTRASPSVFSGAETHVVLRVSVRNCHISTNTEMCVHILHKLSKVKFHEHPFCVLYL